VLFKSFSLGKQVSVIGTVLGGCDPEALNVTSNGEEVVLLLLQANLTVADLHRNVSVASFLEVYLLSQVVVLGGYALVVTAKSSVFSAELGVLFSDTSSSLSVSSRANCLLRRSALRQSRSFYVSSMRACVRESSKSRDLSLSDWLAASAERDSFISFRRVNSLHISAL